MVLQGKPGWDEEKIRSAMGGDTTVQVQLERPIPVLILYSTSVVMEDGEVRFFEDIYGYDAALERALEQGDRYSAGTEAPAGR
jgi:L,D-transpeptidase YcbB